MSKIGENPIEINSSVQVQIEKDKVVVKGMKGELSVVIPNGIAVALTDGVLKVTRQNNTKKVHALHGLVRSLIANAVKGVNEPWKKTLEIVGTGYRVKPQGEDLLLELGYSHNIVFKRPENIEFKIEGNNKIHVMGIDKQYVGEVAFKIKSTRKPDAYKGKGVRYEGEYIKLKPGKKAKTG